MSPKIVFLILGKTASHHLFSIWLGKKFNMGGEVPKSYYLTNSAPVPEAGMESLSVSSGSSGKKQLQFVVTTVNSILRFFLQFLINNNLFDDWIDCFCNLARWKFMSDGEIAYRVFRKNAAASEIELIPSNKVESHLMYEENEIVCDSPGNCMLFVYHLFDYRLYSTFLTLIYRCYRVW